MMLILIGLLVVLQITMMFVAIPPVMAIIGCIIVLNCAIRWELMGGLFAATLCSIILLVGKLLILFNNSTWLIIIITIILYYIIGIGIGGIIGLLHKQRLILTKSEARYKLVNSELAYEKERLRITLHSIGDGVISTDNHGNITMLNDIARKLIGWPDDTAIGRSFADVFIIINEVTKEKCENIVEKVLESGKIQELANHTVLISKDGTKRPIEDSAAPIRSAEGEIIGAVLVFRDFSEKRQKQKEIEFLSYHDQLTGLYNRRFYIEALEILDSKENLPITIIMGDVDRLKQINDSLGHAKGDALLIKVAELIMKVCRQDDIVARLGGDEFVILLPKIDAFEAEKIIQRIKDLSLNEKVGTVGISISLGYGTKNNEEENIQEIYKSAEVNMYENKHMQRCI